MPGDPEEVGNASEKEDSKADQGRVEPGDGPRAFPVRPPGGIRRSALYANRYARIIPVGATLLFGHRDQVFKTAPRRVGNSRRGGSMFPSGSTFSSHLVAGGAGLLSSDGISGSDCMEGTAGSPGAAGTSSAAVEGDGVGEGTVAIFRISGFRTTMNRSHVRQRKRIARRRYPEATFLPETANGKIRTATTMTIAIRSPAGFDVAFPYILPLGAILRPSIQGCG